MIPHVVHRYWTGGPMPENLRRFGDTWVEHHPDWAHVLWTDETLPALRNQRIFDQADTIAPHNIGQLRADVVRYELLEQHGGVWVDCDLECLKPVDTLLGGVDCFAGWERQNRWVGNTILGSVAGHPFVRALVDGLEANVRRRWGARPAVMTGPQYVTAVYRRHAKSVTVFSERLFYPFGFDELDRAGDEFPDAYARHWWGNRRCRNREPGWEYAR